MSHNSTEEQQYPRDRFDDVEPYSTQQGAHRKEFAAPKGVGQLNAIIIAGGVALAIGVGSFLWLQPSDPLNQAGSASEETAREQVEDEPQDVDETDEPEAIEEPEPTDAPETVDLDQPDETEETALPDVEETEEPETADEVDYEEPIGVYNASTIQGYASSVAQELGSAGFNVPVADNWTGSVPSTTTVYFSGNEATASAVAEELGAIAVYEPSVDGVLVVLTEN